MYPKELHRCPGFSLLSASNLNPSIVGMRYAGRFVFVAGILLGATVATWVALLFVAPDEGSTRLWNARSAEHAEA